MKVTIELDDGTIQTIEGYAAFVSVMQGDDKDNTSVMGGQIDHRDVISMTASLLYRNRMALGETTAAMILRTAEATVLAKIQADGGNGNVN